MLLGCIFHVAVWNSNINRTSEDGIELPIYPSSYFYFYFSEKVCLMFWSICIACRLYHAQNSGPFLWLSCGSRINPTFSRHINPTVSRSYHLSTRYFPGLIIYQADKFVAFLFINPIVLLWQNSDLDMDILIRIKVLIFGPIKKIYGIRCR